MLVAKLISLVAMATVASAAAINLYALSRGSCYCARSDVDTYATASSNSPVALKMIEGTCGAYLDRKLVDGGYWFQIEYWESVGNLQRVWVNSFYMDLSDPSNCIVECPTIIDYKDWGGIDPAGGQELVAPVKYAFIHQTGTPVCLVGPYCGETLRNMNHRSVANYNFMVGGDGTVFLGRGWTKQHEDEAKPLYNSISLGIAFIGSFGYAEPTDFQRMHVQQLLACAVSMGILSSEYEIKGPHDLTADAKTSLDDEIEKWDHYVNNTNSVLKAST